MRSLNLVCAFLALSLVFGGTARNAGASPIVAEVTFHSSGGGAILSDTVYVQMVIGDLPSDADARFATPAPVPISSDDLGQNFLSLTQADIGFDALVDALTNGENDMVWLLDDVRPEVSVGSGGLESRLFFDDPDGIGRVDLQGYKIDQLDFTLDSFVLTSPGTDPNGDGIWTDRETQISLSISGVAVPEPGLHLLFLEGLVVLATARRLTS